MSAARFKPETHVTLKCEVCGDEFDTVTSRIKGGRGRFCSRGCSGHWVIRNCQNKVSLVETDFLDKLDVLGLSFVRQAKVGKWNVDALFESEMLVLEFDGEYWHSLKSAIDRDIRKDAELSSKGYKILRVPEMLYKKSPGICIKMVFDALAI
jgi:very-short-patch-repair endonuclease